jgi:phosphatidylglycerol---prolipoprotein diacylglyceryl transferase
MLALLEIRYRWIDPVALELPGGFGIRWYGLSYMLSFGVAYFLMRYLAKKGFVRFDPDSVGDLVFSVIIGVLLGARLGYILFYEPGVYMNDPARIIRLWEGGLSFHGGLIGAVTGAWWFARARGIPLIHVMDGMALAVPPGIFFVRMANFVNGELYGRVASPDVPWAMRFPTDPVALELIGARQARTFRERELAIGDAYQTGLWDQVRDQVPLRHPSQIYEGLLEGVLLGIILWLLYLWMRRRGTLLPTGTFAGIFLIGYGVFRSFVELFRQPDEQFRTPDNPLGTVLGPLTMGQTLSMGVILAGLLILLYAWRNRHRPPPKPVRARKAA